jgi:hypothetical protein
MKLILLLILILGFSFSFSVHVPVALNLFKQIDTNNNGLLSKRELIQFGARHNPHQPNNIELHKVDRLFTYLDRNRDGIVDKQDWDKVFKLKSLDGDADPEEIHISLTGEFDQMTIMWVTFEKTPSIVEYKVKGDSTYSQTTGVEYTYQGGEFGWYGWIHRVVLQNLKPTTQYVYKVGDGTNWSSEYNFTTQASPNSPPASSYLYGFYGDQGTYIPAGFAVIDQIVKDNSKRRFDLFMHVGDICYAGTGSSWEFESIWDLWENLIQPFAAHIPYMFAVGNHEKYFNYTAYRHRFHMPENGNGNFWYSFNHGLVHWLQMSTEHPYTPGSPQYKWIQEDLIKATKNRDKQPWLFVSGHRSIFCSDKDEWGSREQRQHILSPLFEKYKVDMYLSGHMHMYERVYPVFANGTVDTKALSNNGHVYTNPRPPVYAVQGTGGVFTSFDTYVSPQPAWSAKRNDHWGYGRLEVFNFTHLHYSFQIEETGESDDYFWLIKA